jgi:hypothetical protein
MNKSIQTDLIIGAGLIFTIISIIVIVVNEVNFFVV